MDPKKYVSCTFWPLKCTVIVAGRKICVSSGKLERGIALQFGTNNSRGRLKACYFFRHIIKSVA